MKIICQVRKTLTLNSEDNLTCFKTYDIRGKLDSELNTNIAYRIGRATTQSLKAKSVVVGFDARDTSKNLAQAITKGICDAGADVLFIGLAGTEQIYAAVTAFKAGAGIEVTASHNPIDYNGMKIVSMNCNLYPLENFQKLTISGAK